MRKVTLLLVLVAVLVGGGLVLVNQPQLLLRFGLGGDTAKLFDLALSFMEDIQFKDFVKAATYHAPDIQGDVDIPFLLERLFAIKPEMLDIMDYEVVFAKVDNSGQRARVKTIVKIKDLVRGKIEDRELMLYFHRDDENAPWYMQLESSLRALQGDKTKKH